MTFKAGDWVVIIGIPRARYESPGVPGAIGRVMGLSPPRAPNSRMEPYWHISVQGTPMSASEHVLRRLDPPGREMVAWSQVVWQPRALSTAT